MELARATVALPSCAPEPPELRGDPRIGRGHERPRASRPVFERLRAEGLGAVRARWPEALPDAGWGYGADLDTVKEYAEYWRTTSGPNATSLPQTFKESGYRTVGMGKMCVTSCCGL